MKNKMIPFPQTMWLAPTDRCNTKCKTCSHYYQVFGADMEKVVYEKLKKQVIPHMKMIKAVGGGEPLISHIYMDILDTCEKQKIFIDSFSNLKELNRNILEKLIRLNARIGLSIDGATAEVYNSVRPYIKWQNILDTLANIQQLRNGNPDSSFDVFINMVVMQQYR